MSTSRKSRGAWSVGAGSGALSQRVSPFYRVLHGPANCGRLKLADKATSSYRQEHHAGWIDRRNQTFRTGGTMLKQAGAVRSIVMCLNMATTALQSRCPRSELPGCGLAADGGGANPHSATPFLRAE